MFKVIAYGLLLVCLLVYCAYQAIINRSKISGFIEYVTPPKYSPNNPKVSTVSKKYITPRINNATEIIDFNRDFPVPSLPFRLDDTDLLKAEELTCEPESFGYSREKGELVFPEYIYPKCSQVNNQNDTRLKINDGFLYMDCPGKFKGRYVTGPVNSQKLATQDELYDLWEVHDYKKPAKLSENTEFAIGSCEENPTKTYKEAYMTPNFNEPAYKEAKQKVTGKPKIIFLLTLDSVSRRHFFRKLPKTIEYLNGLNRKDEYFVFDFKLHNILGATSVGNQVPIFGEKEKYNEDYGGSKNIDYIGETALWNILREHGYISLIGLENCDNYFPKSLGRIPHADYVINPFYCAVYKYTDYKLDIEFALKQRCLGAYMTHYYALNYTYNLAGMNQGVNQFLYLHLNAAHEATGLHAATLDEDLPDYIEKFLTSYGKTHDISIFLGADHGMRYGDWFKELSAYQEHKLPSLFLITNREFLSKFPNAYEALSMNTLRLTSKRDIRKTLLYMAGIDENTEFGVNLMKEISPKARTCKDAGIKPLECSCSQMLPVENPDPEFKHFLTRLQNLVEVTINAQSYASPIHSKGSICQKVYINQIEKAYSLQTSNVEEFIRIEMSVIGHPKVRFQATIFVSSYYSDLLTYSSMRYNSNAEVFRSSRVRSKIINISRLDKYAGKCELIAINAGLRADTCLCTDEVLENS
ncbi:unnamed protein product [Blepharisma stoltei]|uniref:Uncharacterized protein n=1 Tax=Blepharisma stoltei TaxID=1481888 RepID=A0AAU9IWX5_9CILI|nr:unnamed protein product [Blepharisma stoltei]